jgi:two-component system, cell cycle sensor histidine kinase and response regulator CckA
MLTGSPTKTVLVADDKDVVRKLLALVLSHQGYTVLQASDGRHAVTIADGYLGDIDLLLTDVIMPDLTGREVAELVLERRPETQILFMSGQDHRVLDEIVLDPRITLLRKPLDLHTLLTHVHRLLP